MPPSLLRHERRSTARRFGFSILLATLLALFGTHTLHADNVTFTLDAKQMTDRPQTVHVAGTFNGWNPTASMLTGNEGLYSVTLDLEEGEYFYKFVLDAGTPRQRWMEDPSADPELKQPDGHGGFNSCVIVGPGAMKAEPLPEHVNLDLVYFDPTKPEDFVRFETDRAQIRVRVLTGDVERVRVLVGSKSTDLPKIGSGRNLDVFSGPVLLPPSTATLEIQLIDGVTQTVTHALPPTPERPFVTPDWARDAVWYQIFPERFRNGDPSNDPGRYWYENLVPWNGDWWSALPGEAPGKENFYRGAGNVWNRRYGGDLQGVLEQLPYLRELGVNAIYFNPVFEGESMHKYDTADFRHVDDNFGALDQPRQPNEPLLTREHAQKLPPIGNRKLYELDGTPLPDDYVQTDDPKTWKWTQSDLIFLDFIKAAREQGFRVVVDGVFNHVGRAHPYFQDVVKRGADSPYASWFEIEAFADKHPADEKDFGKPGGFRFKAWDSPSGWLPAFRKSADKGLAPGPYEHIMAITRRWLDPDNNPDTHDGIDGWRLDVPGDIPHPFWRDWRLVVKDAYADAYITGEIWTPAQPWINAGDQFDAVMNYQFAMACQDFFANQERQISPSQMQRRLGAILTLYPMQATLVMQNLLDSHDTDRAPSWFLNPDRPYDGQNRPQDNAADIGYDDRKPTELHRKQYLQMISFQHTFVGAPMTYYGNEAGMWSPDDPSNRQPLPWDDKGPFVPGTEFDRSVFEHFQRAIAIRNALPALRRGGYAPLLADDERSIFAFERFHDGQRVYVIVNRSDTAQPVTIPAAPGRYVDYHDPSAVNIEMPLIEIATKRPVPVVAPNAQTIEPIEGKITLTVPAWGTAILAAPKAN